MSKKQEIYLVSTEFHGVPMRYGAFENQAEAITVAEQINIAAGNNNARIESVVLTKQGDYEVMCWKCGKKPNYGIFYHCLDCLKEQTLETNIKCPNCSDGTLTQVKTEEFCDIPYIAIRFVCKNCDVTMQVKKEQTLKNASADDTFPPPVKNTVVS